MATEYLDVRLRGVHFNLSECYVAFKAEPGKPHFLDNEYILADKRDADGEVDNLATNAICRKRDVGILYE